MEEIVFDIISNCEVLMIWLKSNFK
jgi:hypothetical protein